MLKNKICVLRVLIAIITLISLLTTSIVSCLLTTSAAAGNLLKNGDFETGNMNNWNNWAGASVVSDESYEGKYCLKLSSKNWGAFFQEFTATPNTSYRLVFWFKDINTAKCGVYIKDVTHGDAEVAQVWFGNVGSSKWEKLVIPFTCPDGATKLKVNFTGDSLTEKYLDNILVEVAPEMSDDGYIKNGDFEIGSTNEWTNWNDSAVVGDVVYDGQYSLKLSGGEWKEFSQEFDVVPGMEYTLTYYLKAAADKQTAAGFIKCGDAEIAKFDIVGNASSWTKQTVKFTPGPSQERVRLLFYAQKFVKYIDNISITAPDLMLKNGNFEKGNYDGWTNLTTASVVSDESHSGRFALKMSSSGRNSFFQDFDVSPNTTYRLVFWVKNINTTPLNAYVKDVTGGKDINITEKQVNGSGSEWTKILIPFISPADAAKMRIGFCGDSLTEKYLDDIKVVYLPDVSDDGFIKNGTFETSEADEWTVENASVVTEEEAYEGIYSLKLTGTTGTSVYQVFDVEPGIEHTLTFYGKAAESKKKSVGYIKDADTGKELSSFDMSFSDTDWTKQTVKFTPEAATIRVKLVFSPEGNTNYLDNVSVFAPESPFPNGGFEKGVEGWTINNSSVVENGTAARSGNKGLHLVKSGSSDDLSTVTRKLKVNGKTKYRLIFWYKNESAGESGIYIKYKKPFGSGETELVSDTINGSTTEWTKKIIDFTVPAGITELNLVFCPLKSGKYLDDFTLKAIIAASDDGFIKNGDFETGTTECWTNENTSEISFSEAHSGDASLKLTGGEWSAFYQSFDVEPNSEYTLNVWGKTAVSGKNGMIYIKEVKGDKDFEFISEATAFSAGEWTLQTIRFSTGSTMTKVKLVFFPQGNTLYLDDIGIVAVESLIKNGGFETGNFKNWTIGTNSGSKVVNYAAHSGNYGVHLDGYKWALHRQDFAVKPGTTYEVGCWFKDVAHSGASYIVIRAGNTTDNILAIPLQANDDDWHYVSGLFNSNSWTTMRVQLSTESGAKYIDDISVIELGVAQDLHAITNFAPRLLRVDANSNNLISGADFESEGDWNTSRFIGGPLEVLEDADKAHNGTKVLHFKGEGLDTQEKRVFWADVEPNTQYMFSAWVKGPNISSTNCADATFGVIDPVSKKFLIGDPLASDPGYSMDSTQDRQLVPTAYDNSWHLRGIEFNSGERDEVGIAVYASNSELYLDELVLCKVENAVKYNAIYNTSTISVSPNEGDSGCNSEDNLIGNFNLSENRSDFWETGYIYDNFVSIVDAKLGYGRSLKYSESENPVGNTYVKWVDVEPNRNYIFTFDIQVTKDGNGSISLLDNKNTIPTSGLELTFDTADFGDGWHTVSVCFNPGVYDKAGICFTDLGGEAYVDNIRIFEASKANASKEVFNPDEIVIKEEDDQSPPDSDANLPNTGDLLFKTVMSVIAVSLLGFIFAIGFLRLRKKER